MIELRDGICALHELEPLSVGLVLSDLPSGETAAPTDVMPSLPRLWSAVWDTLAPGGNVVFMAHSMRFAAKLIASQERFFRYDLVWAKSRNTGHLNVGRMPMRSHEFVLVFGQGAGNYNPQMMKDMPLSSSSRNRNCGQNYGNTTGEYEIRTDVTTRYPGSVLDFQAVPKTSPERIHHQQKPVPLLRWLIRTYSNAGDLVIDPFAGSGSTGVADRAEGRLFKGYDSDPKYGTVNHE